MNILVFFTPKGKQRPCWYDRPRMLEMLAASAHRAMRNPRMILVGDDTTEYPGWEKYPAPGGGIMYERCAAFSDALGKIDGMSLCVDIDTLIVRDPTPLFVADLNIPVRGQRAAAGVIYVKTPAAGSALFADMAARYAAMTEREKRGIQIDGALEQIVFSKNGPISRYRDWSVSTPTFDEANFAPEPMTTPDEANAAFLWHFKGLRKNFMPEYYACLQ